MGRDNKAHDHQLFMTNNQSIIVTSIPYLHHRKTSPTPENKLYNSKIFYLKFSILAY